jgi:DNA repair exonuclease SbcCD nuclease subunit
VTVRFIHTADWQLGLTRHFLDGEAQSRFSQARLDAIRRIGGLAREHHAEFVVVAGDVFETNQVSRQTVLRACAALAEVPVPVFLLPGNHDPLDAASVFRQPAFVDRKPHQVHVLVDATPHVLRPGVEVIGAPWSSKRPLSDLVGDAAATLVPVPGTTRILVGHGATDDVMDFAGPATIRVTDAEAALADGRVAYIALGDRHSTTEVGAGGRIWYAGAPEPTDYDEVASGSVLLVELDEHESGTSRAPACTVTPLRTGTWRFALHRADLAGDADVEALAAWFAALPAPDRTIAKLVLVGTLTIRQDARLAALLDDEGARLGAMEQWERHRDLVVVADDADFADLDLSGFARVALDRLRQTATGAGDDATAARDALGLLVRLAASSG